MMAAGAMQRTYEEVRLHACCLMHTEALHWGVSQSIRNENVLHAGVQIY